MRKLKPGPAFRTCASSPRIPCRSISSRATTRASGTRGVSASSDSDTAGLLPNHLLWAICTALTPYISRKRNANRPIRRCVLRMNLYIALPGEGVEQKEGAASERKNIASGTIPRAGREPEIDAGDRHPDQGPDGKIVVIGPIPNAPVGGAGVDGGSVQAVQIVGERVSAGLE